VTYGPYYLFGTAVAKNKLIPVVIAFAINYAAYFAEIYRGGIESIPVGQYEAANVLGYTRAQTFLRIILPQVVKRIMPSITNEVVTLVKDTSMAFTVSYQEMFTIGKQIANSQTSFMPFLVAGVFYFVFNAIVDFVMGKIEKRQYPPRMTPHLRQAVMRFERYQAQFAFLRENNITTPADMAVFEQRTEETLGRLTKQRTLLNVRKKKRQPLYAALADAEALEPSRALYEEGLTGMEQEFEQYMKAVKLLKDSGVPQEVLRKEKAEVYEQLSEVNRKIRAEREKWKLCRDICRQTPVMEQDIQKTEEHQKEVREHEHRRR